MTNLKNVEYGISSKFNFGKWEHILHGPFKSEEAYNWLHTEEYDFRERELMSKEKAIEFVGEDEVYYHSLL